jgi:hypothetical protein
MGAPATQTGDIPISVKDPIAQDLLWELSIRYIGKDAEFAVKLQADLIASGFDPPKPVRIGDTVQHIRTNEKLRVCSFTSSACNDFWATEVGDNLELHGSFALPPAGRVRGPFEQAAFKIVGRVSL